jgi:hypothetical protein
VVVTVPSQANDNMGCGFPWDHKTRITNNGDETVITVVVPHHFELGPVPEPQFGCTVVCVREHHALLARVTFTQRPLLSRLATTLATCFAFGPTKGAQLIRLPNALRPPMPTAMIPRQIEIQTMDVAGCVASIAIW